MSRKNRLMNSTCLPAATVARSQASDPRVKTVDGLNSHRFSLAAPVIEYKGKSDV